MNQADESAKPPTRAQLIREFNSGKLLGTIFSKYSRKWGKDADTVRVIAAAHNSGAIDVLKILQVEDLRENAGGMFFQGQSLYCSLFPKLRASAPEMLEAADALVRAAGNDGAASYPASALAEWSEAKRGRSKELLDLADSGNPIAIKYLPLILRTGAKSNRTLFLARAHLMAKEGSHQTKLSAVMALGQIPPKTRKDWQSLLDTFTLVANQNSDELNAKLVDSICALLAVQTSPLAHTFESLVGRIITENPGPQTLHECADALWFRRGKISESLVAGLLDALLNIDFQNKLTVSHLDHALAEMVRHGELDRPRQFLQWLFEKKGSEATFEQFEDTVHALQDRAPADLLSWLVPWLLRGSTRLCDEFAGSLFEGALEGKPLTVDPCQFALTDEEITFLARKAIGHFFLKPITATTVVLSLLRFSSPDVQTELEDLLFDPLLLNYALVAEKVLEPIAGDPADPAQLAAKNALSRLENYLTGLRNAKVKELHPSERERLIEYQRHVDSMAKSYESGKKKSILADLFAKVIVLHGRRSISYHKSGDEEPRRLEIPMQEHGVSFEIPRVDIVDPMGLQKTLLSFRLERLKS